LTKKNINTISFILRLLIWLIGIIIILNQFGLKITNLLAGLGISGIIIALAAQSLFSDLFSYASIILDKPFEIDDFISIEDFMNTMMQKYEGSLRQFNDTMSFTWMSKHVLEEKVHAQYGNVYEKGALIGMCLDILLRDLSQGSYGTQNLMKDLAKQYGKDKSFNDADLFADIEKLTYPEVGAFLLTHVGGGKPLPMQEIFAKIGINFAKEAESYEFSLGNPELGLNTKTSRIYVEGTSNLDEFGKALKLKRGDELYKLNGNELKLDRLKDVVSGFYASVKEGDEVVLEVYRPRLLKNRYRRVELKAKAKKVKVVRSNRISLMENLSGKQRQTLKSWAGLKA